MIGYNRLGINGRLCNQMFQYASLRGIAAKHGYDFCIPPRDRETYDMADYILMDGFKLPHAKNIGYIPEDRPIHDEPSHDFDLELFENCPDNINLEGFRQSEKYFKHIEKEIREDFTFNDEIVQDCNEIMSEVGDAIFIHIRRGDYVATPNHHPVLPIEYYEEGLKRFDPDIPVLVFSDALDWVREQKLFDGDRFLVAEGNVNYVDLCLMTLCSGHIIANSSFSWWGAWLSNSEKVIAPKNWFSGHLEDQDTKDLY